MTEPYKCLQINPNATSMEVEKARFLAIEKVEDNGYGPGNLKHREITWSADLLKSRENRAAYDKTILSTSFNKVSGFDVSDIETALLMELKIVLHVDSYLEIINNDVSKMDFSFCFFSVDEHVDAGRMVAAFLMLIRVFNVIDDEEVKPRILFKLADFCISRLSDRNWQKVFLKKIISNYPESKEAHRAEDLI